MLRKFRKKYQQPEIFFAHVFPERHISAFFQAFHCIDGNIQFLGYLIVVFALQVEQYDFFVTVAAGGRWRHRGYGWFPVR